MLPRRSILVAAFAAGTLAIVPALAQTAPAFDAKAFADAQKAGKPILIAIHAPWCPTCKAQAPILGELRADPGSRTSLISSSISTARRMWSSAWAPTCSRR